MQSEIHKPAKSEKTPRRKNKIPEQVSGAMDLFVSSKRQKTDGEQGFFIIFQMHSIAQACSRHFFQQCFNYLHEISLFCSHLINFRAVFPSFSNQCIALISLVANSRTNMACLLYILPQKF